MAIVKTNINYTYETMISDLHKLNTTYPFLQIQNAGYSVLGKSLPVVRLGRGLKKVFYSASFHAQEWITTVLLMKFIEDYCIAYNNNSRLYGYSVRRLFNSVSIYIMPMVNPDGVDLVTYNLNPFSSAYLRSQKIANQFPDIPFPSRMEG